MVKKPSHATVPLKGSYRMGDVADFANNLRASLLCKLSIDTTFHLARQYL